MEITLPPQCPPPIGLIRINWKRSPVSSLRDYLISPPIGLIRINWKLNLDKRTVVFHQDDAPPIGLIRISWKRKNKPSILRRAFLLTKLRRQITRRLTFDI